MSSSRIVLVVEDEPAIRSLIGLVLEGEGYAVESASDGLEALAIVQRVRPNALVVDLDIPIMDGFELVRACRAEEGVRRLPIIVMSAVYHGEKVDALDVEAFLSKPFDVDRLLVVLLDVIR